ncbi:hypothetical protein RI054_12g61850 [Pseudoscourfieldia marina]
MAPTDGRGSLSMDFSAMQHPAPSNVGQSEGNEKLAKKRGHSYLPRIRSSWRPRSRMTLRDCFTNTEVCEQTFSIFVKFKAAFRAMDKDTSELFITRMSIVHNEEITLVLMKKKHNPTPGVEHFTPREKVAVHEHPFFTGRVYAD